MNFRTILRQATRPEHDHLDGVFTAIDIAQRDGFARFINVHLVCFQVMSERSDVESYSHKLLRQMVRCLAMDADVLGVRQVQTMAGLQTTPDPLAVDYLVAGSRLGSRVMRKRWLASNDPTVRRAKAYFDLESDPDFWPKTCQALGDIAPQAARATAITRDAKDLFDLFSTVFETTVVTEATAL